MSQQSLNLGVIGNGALAALVDEKGAVVWMCLPRFDGTPVFNALLGGEGVFAVDLVGLKATRQYYVRNTAALVTELEAADGAILKITDFAPRFEARGRTFRPTSFIRQITPQKGQPRVSLRLTPQAGWTGPAMRVRRGISHVTFLDGAEGASDFRLTTDAPLSYVMGGTPFIVDQEYSFLFGPDEPLSDAVGRLADEWREQTLDHWRAWTRSLAIPSEWQEAVIRAAITLKLCVYEETGGIVAALTTSIPEHEGCARNWDYRFCWLRDAYFTVTALNRLSAMGTLENYLLFLRNIVAQTEGGHIQPVYGISLERDLREELIDGLPGYRGFGPVRRGNAAATHIQHDVYGDVILGETQAFFDERLLKRAGAPEFFALERVGERAYSVYNTPDAGIWEYRTRADIHTSSAMMCFAACDRLARIAWRLNFPDRARVWADRAEEIREVVLKEGWNEKVGAFTGAYGREDLDASVLLMAEVGVIPADDPRFVSTVDAVNRELREGCHIFRYRAEDDFGRPKTAFTACTFWHIDALARTGRIDEARDMFECVLATRNPLGLLSEDTDPATGELWGNYPQTYSMVGIINVAARLSRRWEDVV